MVPDTSAPSRAKMDNGPRNRAEGSARCRRKEVTGSSYSAVNRSGRRGLVLDVEGPDGNPPFLVRWEDNGHEGLIFPGPDAHVAAPGSVSNSDSG